MSQYMLSKRKQKQKQKRTDKHTNTLTVPSYKAQLLQAPACKSWALYDGTVNVFVCLSVRFCFCFRLLSIYCIYTGACKSWALYDGAVILFVCLSVCLFVCLSDFCLWNLWSHSLGSSTWQWVAVYRIDSVTLVHTVSISCVLSDLLASCWSTDATDCWAARLVNCISGCWRPRRVSRWQSAVHFSSRPAW